MLKIQLSENEQVENKLLVEGKFVSEKFGYVSSIGKREFYARIHDYELSERIFESSFKEIPNEIYSLEMYYPLEFTEFIKEIEIARDYHNREIIQLNFKFFWDFEKWKYPFSIEEFATAMEDILPEYMEMGIEWVQEDPDTISNGCHIGYPIINKNETIKAAIEKNIPFIKEITKKVNLLLFKKSKNGSLINSFDFPEHVRVPCEQYLAHFVEFLKNVGIDATSEISYGAGSVLFSITPKSKETALEQIRKALAIYLQLPNVFKNYSLKSTHMKPAEQLLVKNIQHLLEQISLTNTLIQTQNETIYNQRIIIENQQRVMESTIHQYSLLLNTKKSDLKDKEEILGGFISLAVFEWKGFQVNFPNVYRWLKKKIKK